MPYTSRSCGRCSECFRILPFDFRFHGSENAWCLVEENAFCSHAYHATSMSSESQLGPSAFARSWSGGSRLTLIHQTKIILGFIGDLFFCRGFLFNSPGHWNGQIRCCGDVQWPENLPCPAAEISVTCVACWWAPWPPQNPCFHRRRGAGRSGLGRPETGFALAVCEAVEKKGLRL